ncbi:hypothetical protein D3C85_277570 [compost metagenome]
MCHLNTIPLESYDSNNQKITNKTNAFYYPEKLFFTMKCKTERFYYKFILFQTKLFNYEIQKHQKFFFNDSCIFSYCCHGTT